MMRRTLVGMAGLLLFAAVAGAQPPSDRPARSFDEVRFRVKVGDSVRVIDTSGAETRGRAAAVSDVALTLTVDGAPREFVADAVRRIDRRRRDSVRNGLLIGAGTGAALGFGLGRSADSRGCPRSGAECGQGVLIGTVGGAFWGAIGGWIADAVIRKREVIYLAP